MSWNNKAEIDIIVTCTNMLWI